MSNTTVKFPTGDRSKLKKISELEVGDGFIDKDGDFGIVLDVFNNIGGVVGERYNVLAVANGLNTDDREPFLWTPSGDTLVRPVRVVITFEEL